MHLKIRYEPVGPVAEAFLASDAFVRGIRGPFGSGKSTVCCVDILRRALAQRPGPDGKRRSRWAIVRNTYPELKTTTIKTWHGIVPSQVGQWVDSGPPRHVLLGEDFEIEIWFLALDSPEDVKKLLSMDLTGAWINEARETPKSILDGLTARVGRYPGIAQGGPSWFGVLMDTNPPDSDHWWYKLAEEETPQGFAFFAQPSGLSDAAENRDNLPAGYYERLCSGKSDEWIKVYVRGEYGFVADGRPVFPEYSDSTHCQPFELAPRLPLYVGIDFGLTPAALIGQRTAMGAWRWRYELCTEHMGAKRFGELVLGPKLEQLRQAGFTFAAITGDPAGDQSAQTDETTPFKILRAAKIDARPAHTNDFTIRREAVAQALGRLIDGRPGFLLHPECAVTRRGMGGRYAYRRLQIAGTERYADQPEKNLYSHPCEALQYGMMGGGEGKAIVRATTARPRQRYAIT